MYENRGLLRCLKGTSGTFYQQSRLIVFFTVQRPVPNSYPTAGRVWYREIPILSLVQY